MPKESNEEIRKKADEYIEETAVNYVWGTHEYEHGKCPHCFRHPRDSFMAGYGQGVQALWIPIVERMPQRNVLVIGITTSKRITECFWWQDENGEKGWTDESWAEVMGFGYITHWQPLTLPTDLIQLPEIEGA